jgi:indole-3-acetate monooxygenase
VTAFLDQQVGRAMYPDLLGATAGAITPTGQARRVAGGYRVSGRFPFASGCHHSELAWLGCTVSEGGAPRVSGDGVPETRQCFLRLSDCEVLDTWYTTGLRGTGSDDLAVHDVFVPEAQSFSFQDPHLIKREGPLYAFPFMFAANGTAPALGVARHAIDALIDSAATKPARRYMLGERVEAPKTLRDDVFVQEATARAEALLGAARAYVFDVVGDLWATLLDGRPPNNRQFAAFMALYAQAVGMCVEAVQLVCRAAGGSAVYQKGRSIAACATSWR